MIGARDKGICGAGGIKAAVAFLMFASLVACSGGAIVGTQPEPPAPPAPRSPPPTPPPIDLAGRWQLTAAAGGACFMNFANAPGAPADADNPQASAVQGTIAPEGGCPGNFFTSRKWAFEQGMLIVRDFKGRPLAQLSFSVGQFEGHDASGALLTLSKQP